jgi:drug/metabolite transporter (DMT)-like permease
MKLRVWLLTAIVVLANVGGNVILKQAMLYAPPSAGPIASILQPVAVLGIAVLTAWMLLRMWLLGMADLSFVVPVSAVGYVLSAFAGVWFFAERVPARAWLGIVLVMLGAILTGLTEHSQPDPAAPARASFPSRDGEGAESPGRRSERPAPGAIPPSPHPRSAPSSTAVIE